MNNNLKRKEKDPLKRKAIMYSFAGIADTMSYQMFTFYIFNYYYTVVLGDIFLVSLGYILWSIWNAINDPLIGILSDRTSTKWGRRKPYIVGGIIPTCIILVLLWMAPVDSGIIGFIYFIIMINLFDTSYTSYSLSQTSLFPEMFQNLEERTKANNYVQIFNIIGLLFAAILPSLFIEELLSPATSIPVRLNVQSQYIFASIIMAILAAIFAAIFIIFGIQERKEYSKDPEKAPSFFKAMKFTFKNKAFSIYITTNLMQWYIFGLVPIINPYFLKYIINIPSAFIQQILLAIIFVSAICFMIFWRNYFAKHGARKGQMTALAITLLTFLPFFFIWEIIGALITYIALGFGFAGIMFGRDVIMGAIIDKDELETGVRREAAYYGINALIIRFSTIFVSLSLLIVFNSIGWKIYDPSTITDTILVGIRILICVFPIIGLAIGILFLKFFPITKEKYEEIKNQLNQIHEEKKRKVL